MTTDTETIGPIFPSLARRPSRKGDSIRKRVLLQRMPPEWNVRALTEADLYRYCGEAGIGLREAPIDEQRGLYLRYRGRPWIFIGDKLRGAEKLFVCFHELGHHWLHRKSLQFFDGGEEAVEYEADIVAACAMIPLTALLGYGAGAGVDISDCPRELVRVRREVFDRWRI